MGTDEDFWNSYNNIKFSKNLILKEYVFSGKDEFIKFIRGVNDLIGKEYAQCKIVLDNDFGSIKLNSIDQLSKYINKYKIMYHLNIILLSTENKRCINAIELNYTMFESKNLKTYIKLYSDQESWIYSRHDSVCKLLPHRNYIGILFNDTSTFLLSLILILIVSSKYIFDQANSNIINNPVSKYNLAIHYTIKLTDFFVLALVVYIVLYFISALRIIFIPKFTINKTMNSNVSFYRIKKIFQDPYDILKFIFSASAFLITVISFIRK